MARSSALWCGAVLAVYSLIWVHTNSVGLSFGAESFEQTLRQGGHFPAWSVDDLREIVPQEELRRKLVAEIHSRRKRLSATADFFEQVAHQALRAINRLHENLGVT